jgi:hypothetical protein
VVSFERSADLVESFRACLDTIKMKKTLTYNENRILDCAVRDLSATSAELFRIFAMTILDKESEKTQNTTKI